MAQLDIVLEVITRSLNHYHRLQNFPVRIGRALDNDIILSDPTVSDYHMEIDQGDDSHLIIRNLSAENGSRVNRQSLRQKDQEQVIALEQGPVHLNFGSRRARLLRSDMEVERTSVRQCTGFYALFCNPIWSIALALLTMFAFLIDNHLQTMYQKDFSFYLSGTLPYALGMIALTLLVAGISRLSIQRWEVGAALSLVALFMLTPHLIGELGHKLNYFFTSVWPLKTMVVISNFLLLPVLLTIYLRLVHHSPTLAAISVALLLSAPLLLYQASDLADQMAIADEFTGEANFSRELSALDVRLAPTLAIDAFIEETQLEFSNKNKVE